MNDDADEEDVYNYAEVVLSCKSRILGRLERDESRLTKGKQLGEGQFGVVLLGQLAHPSGSKERSQEVAIKTIQTASQSTKATIDRALLIVTVASHLSR